MYNVGQQQGCQALLSPCCSPMQAPAQALAAVTVKRFRGNASAL